MKFAIVIGSARENRVSDRQAKWLKSVAEDIASDHEWNLVDLKEYDLPLMEEPLPPMAGKRPELTDAQNDYLKVMGEADGFIMVTPEYNHGMPAVLKNAIDTLDYQLMKKPVAIASHGVVGGARANEQVRLVINSNLGGLPIPQSGTFFGTLSDLIDENGVLSSEDRFNHKHAVGMIESLMWYAAALKTARENEK